MKKDLASHEALMGKTKDGMCEYKNEEKTMKKMTREEIQEKFHSPDQPGVMHAMFDEVVDFVINNYDFKHRKIYVVMGQSDASNFIMKPYTTREAAEKFIDDEKAKGGWDKAPYIEEHELN